MSSTTRFAPEFVSLMPYNLEEGVLYISVDYALMTHLCASGCGEKVVLPIHPKQWRFTYDGQSISVYPSVGNIGISCNSHYWIANGEVEWSGEISKRQAQLRHQRDRRDVAGSRAALPAPRVEPEVKPQSIWDRIVSIFERRD